MRYIPTPLTRELRIDSIVSIHYFEYTPEFSFPGESHDFWELIYCDKGSLRIFDGTEWLELSRGQAFLHPPEQFHNVRTSADLSANSIILSFYSDTEALSGIAGKRLSVDAYTTNALFSILREARASFRNHPGQIYDAQLLRKERADYFGSEQVIQNYIELLLIHLIRKNDVGPQFPELPPDARKSPLFREIVDYMETHLGEKLTFSDLVARFSISPTTLKTLFRTHCGCGTMEYLTILRIEHAKTLLLSGTLSCTAIADLCGFCSVHHFSKVFKDVVRMSPTEYTKSIKALLENT